MPILAPVQARPLSSPGWLLSDIRAVSHSHTRVFQLLRERVQHAEHEHAVSAAIEAGMNRRSDLMPTSSDAEVRKNDGSASLQGRREVHAQPGVEQAECALFAQLRVLFNGLGFEIGDIASHVTPSLP